MFVRHHEAPCVLFYYITVLSMTWLSKKKYSQCTTVIILVRNGGRLMLSDSTFYDIFVALQCQLKNIKVCRRVSSRMVRRIRQYCSVKCRPHNNRWCHTCVCVYEREKERERSWWLWTVKALDNDTNNNNNNNENAAAKKKNREKWIENNVLAFVCVHYVFFCPSGIPKHQHEHIAHKPYNADYIAA